MCAMHITPTDQPGRFRVRASLGFDDQGKRIQRSATLDATTRTIRKVAAEWEAAQRSTLENPAPSTERTVDDVWAELIHLNRNRWAAGTLKHHRGARARAGVDGFGATPVDQLDRVTVRDYLQRYADRPVGTVNPRQRAQSTIRQELRLVQRVVGYAYDMEYLDRNPTHRLEVPSGRKPVRYKVPALADLSGVIFDAIDIAPMKAEGRYWMPLAVRIALATGMRAGEVCGLRWGDITTDGGVTVVMMQRHVRRDPEQATGVTQLLVIDSSKTARDRRFAIDRGTATALDARRATVEGEMFANGLVPPVDGFVFSDDWGASPMNPERVGKWWQKVRSTAGLGVMKFHDLRKVSESALHSGGFDLAAIAERQGHSQEVSMRYYNLVRPGADTEAADYIGALLDGGR